MVCTLSTRKKVSILNKICIFISTNEWMIFYKLKKNVLSLQRSIKKQVNFKLNKVQGDST